MLSKKMGLISPFNVVFKAGTAPSDVKSLREVPINFFDYDNYMNANKIKERIIKGPYCVFLDVNLPFHDDLKWVGLTYVDPKKYYLSLNKFFNLLEKKYKIEVVIAAHPTAKYDDKIFYGRKILKGVAPQLVKDSEFVISHHSTSISYAVLNKKPIVFIYSDDILRAYKETIVSFIKDFSEYLGRGMWNIDEITSAEQVVIGPVSEQKYDMYKYSFLTSKEVENKRSEEIFLEGIIS